MINVVTVYKPNHHNQGDYKMNLPAQPSPVIYDIYSKSLSLIFFLKKTEKMLWELQINRGAVGCSRVDFKRNPIIVYITVSMKTACAAPFDVRSNI